MSLLYSDNANRAQRVNDLASDIAFIQTSMGQTRNQMAANDQNAYAFLEQVAVAANFPTVHEYIDNALKMLPEDERNAYEQLRTQLTAQNQACATALDVCGGVAGIAAMILIGNAAGPAVVSKLVVIFAQVRRLMVYRIIAEVVADAVNQVVSGIKNLFGIVNEADAATGTELTAVNQLEINLADTQVGKILAGGDEAVSLVSRIGKVVVTVSKYVEVVAILATIGTLIYEGIEGAKQKEELQSDTLELCSKRFYCEKTSLEVGQAMSDILKMQTLIVDQKTYNDLVKSGTITQAEANAQMTTSINSQVAAYTACMVDIPDATVLQPLATMDQQSNSWTNEDPTLDQMKAWLAAQPAPSGTTTPAIGSSSAASSSSASPAAPGSPVIAPQPTANPTATVPTTTVPAGPT